MTERYRINAPMVVAEVIDGEAVIMNLQSGHYYSTVGVGCTLWEYIVSGHTREELASLLTSRYSVNGANLDGDVGSFLENLERHDLIVPSVNGGGAEAPTIPYAGSPESYTSPVLAVFTDMEDLLLLDPIHDVGEAGWPMPSRAEVPVPGGERG